MKLSSSLALISSLVLSGCATIPPSGSPASEASPLTVASSAAFDHGCPLEQVRIIRADAEYIVRASTVDLDVCGSVRRYKVIRDSGGPAHRQTWLDVTSLYPASSLPAPLSSSAPVTK